MLSLASAELSAQTDTLSIKMFSVVDSVAKTPSGGYVFTIDSIKKTPRLFNADLSQFLMREAGLAFKDNGPGLLSTPTFRGGDANHTQVVWNGVVLNSPLLGTTDFSILPIHQFDNVSILSGTGSSLYTSGGIGSIVSLEQQLIYDRYLSSQSISAGSFGNLQSSVFVNAPLPLRKKSAISFHADFLRNQNNFPYRDIANQPVKENMLQAASFQRSNISLTYGTFLGKSTVLEFTYWRNEAERDIPSPINVDQPSASQEDVANRGLIAIKSSFNQWRIQSRTMIENNLNAYQDDRINIDNTNAFNAIQQQVEVANRHSEHFETFARAGFQIISATSENYIGTLRSNQISGLAVERFQFAKKRIQGDLGVRIEQWDRFNAVLPMGSVFVRPLVNLNAKLNAAVARTARFPTMNERYWNPGGNPNILPEHGWTAEIGSSVDLRAMRIDFTLYQSHVNNRVRWLPNGSFFSPENIDLAEIQGFDANVQLTQQIGVTQFTYKGSYHYTYAVGASEGEPLLPLTYIPKHVASQQLKLDMNSLRIFVYHQIMGRRDVVPGGSLYMPSYQLISSGVSHTSRLSSKARLEIAIYMDNVLDVNYQNMPWRPMPGRAFHFTLNLKWGE